jgi:hypothetical protein
MTAPLAKARTKWSRSFNRKAKNPPTIVETKVRNATKMAIIFAIIAEIDLRYNF